MKKWYQSKTIIVNAIVAALVALEAGTGLLQQFLPANFYAIIAVGLPIVNAILRVITTQAVAMPGAKDADS